MDVLLDIMGYNTDKGYGNFENDKNGCIYFDADYIKTNDIKQPIPDFCDLPLLSNNITLDLSNMSFEPPKDLPKWLIPTIIVAVIVIIVVIVIVIYFKCIKNRKSDSVTSATSGQSSTSFISLVKQSDL